MKALNSSLYECRVFHRRYIRASTRFHYRVFMAFLNLDELPELNRRLSWFGWNRWRPLAYYDSDHFRWLPSDSSANDSGPCVTRERVERYLLENGEDYKPGRIMLFTNLRVLGYVFNPVSFFYCYDANGDLRSIIAEVNNTYLEQKPFLIPVEPGQQRVEWRTLKNFYVSPFIAHNTDFRFRFRAPGELMNVRIDSLRAHHPVLKAVVHGRSRDFTNWALIAMFFRYPFVSLKIITAIHWQALRLFFLKIHVHDKSESDKNIRELKKEREALHL